MPHTSSKRQKPKTPATFDQCLQQIEKFSTAAETLNTSSNPAERLEFSADVDCFLNSDLTTLIEKEQYGKVCNFLQSLRKKLVRHQQVSQFSKRIFKPPSRQRRIWMSNHLKAMRQM